MRVRDPGLADLRVTRGRRRGHRLSHVRLLARMAQEPRNAFTASLAAQGAQHTRTTLDKAVASGVELMASCHALEAEVETFVRVAVWDSRCPEAWHVEGRRPAMGGFNKQVVLVVYIKIRKHTTKILLVACDSLP